MRKARQPGQRRSRLGQAASSRLCFCGIFQIPCWNKRLFSKKRALAPGHLQLGGLWGRWGVRGGRKFFCRMQRPKRRPAGPCPLAGRPYGHRQRRKGLSSPPTPGVTGPGPNERYGRDRGKPGESAWRRSAISAFFSATAPTPPKTAADGTERADNGGGRLWGGGQAPPFRGLPCRSRTGGKFFSAGGKAVLPPLRPAHRRPLPGRRRFQTWQAMPAML